MIRIKEHVKEYKSLTKIVNMTKWRKKKAHALFECFASSYTVDVQIE